ncbi:sulfurtransferase complex subunit TusC [Pseudomonas sp. dw_358]|uniref:sulfurtransferase complex subunit TusC n=1 Tax=Pseudomonas sp. dw_358 TaxID=2720083 RepID=UPI001BD62069|nr:sulfurtransferase complex subunit TusC [Pseudomonas sp. dw_358]
MAKSLLIVSRQAPWTGPGAREALDIALAGGAYDLPLAMLFLDDGVFQLASSQQPVQLQQKDLGANLNALPMFGVEDLYVCVSSLVERGLSTEGLTLPVRALQAAELTGLFDRFDHVITL